MDWRSRIVAHPDVLVGKPVIKGTRISVELVMDLLAAGTDSSVPIRRPYLSSGGTRNVCFTYSMFARVSATMSFVGDPVSSTYHPR